MKTLQPQDLMSLEMYAQKREEFRQRTLAIKEHRKVSLGEHIRLLFENLDTIQYQVQEMLRIERIFEQEGILDELSAYNPLIPDGNNLKATMMIEYSDVAERKVALAKFINIENCVSLSVSNGEKIMPVCNEDLTRSTDEKTASVHFMRFELDNEQIRLFKQGAQVIFAIDHPHYQAQTILSDQIQQALATDFD